MVNHGKSWDNWRVPTDRVPEPECFEGGLSSIAFDSYVFGRKRYEVYVEEGHFTVLDKVAGGKLTDTGEVARLPLPATFDEVVTWARMVAAVHGGERE